MLASPQCVIHVHMDSRLMFSSISVVFCYALLSVPQAHTLRTPVDRASVEAPRSWPRSNQHMYVQQAIDKKYGSHHHHHHHDTGSGAVCDEGPWREQVLKLVHEIPAAGMHSHTILTVRGDSRLVECPFGYAGLQASDCLWWADTCHESL